MKRWMILGLIACACGSSDGGNNNPGGSITGTVGGQPLDVKDAVFGVDAAKAVFVFVGDRTGICSLLAGTTLPGTTTVLQLALVNIIGPTNAHLGDYTVGNYAWIDLGNPSISSPGLYFGAGFAVASSCTTVPHTVATGGTLTVTQVGNSTGTHLKATLTNLKFGTDTLNGTFEAAYCAEAVNPTCGSTLRSRPPAPGE